MSVFFVPFTFFFPDNCLLILSRFRFFCPVAFFFCPATVPWVQDTQAAFLLLLMCGSTRANFWLRSVQPDLTEGFAERHNTAVWGCLRAILGTPSAPDEAQVLATLALSGGGLGLSIALAELPRNQQGLRVLGVPIGQPEFVRDFLEVKTREQATLFQRIPWGGRGRDKKNATGQKKKRKRDKKNSIRDKIKK